MRPTRSELLGDEGAVQFSDRGGTDETHCSPHIFTPPAQQRVDPDLSRRAERVEIGPTRHHGIGTGSYRLHDVATPTHTSVADDLRSTTNRIGNR